MLVSLEFDAEWPSLVFMCKEPVFVPAGVEKIM
jgi:hypothetical protein